MPGKIATYYWIVILVLQTTIIINKIISTGFYLWNIVALVGSGFFLYNRIVKNKVTSDKEIQLAAFIGIFATTTFIAQLMRLSDELEAVISLAVSVSSFWVAHYIWKTTRKNNVN